MWKIEKIVSKGDYNYCVVLNHPKRNKYGYVLYHRVIVENYLNRLLTEDEIVHHIDGNKKNNIISNLALMSKAKHNSLHSKAKGRMYVVLKCPNCGIVFEKPQNKTNINKPQKATFCSRKCSGLFYSKQSTTISENILKVYRKF